MGKITNVGLVKAIFSSTTAPSNTKVIWWDEVNLVHKSYNHSTLQWEPLVEMVLIDAVTIKKDIDGKLYVDATTLPGYTVPNGSITLIKMADVPSGTVFYRKSAGNGAPEVQTLSQLKTDLGLTGINSGDQNLSIYVLKTTTINGKPLTGNINLVASDVNAPSGSGTSTGTNTGDETEATILGKLGINILSGDNTGDQVAADVPVMDAEDLFVGTNVEEILTELYHLSSQNKNVFTISLPSSTTVAGRIAAAVAGVDYPSDWTLAAGVSPVDLLITHNLDRRIANVSVFAVTGTEEQMLFNTAAFNGIKTPNTNSLLIQSLATINKTIKIYIIGA